MRNWERKNVECRMINGNRIRHLKNQKMKDKTW